MLDHLLPPNKEQTMTDYQHSFSRSRPEQAHLPFVICHLSFVIGHWSFLIDPFRRLLSENTSQK